jgi:hypothetical protein
VKVDAGGYRVRAHRHRGRLRTAWSEGFDDVQKTHCLGLLQNGSRDGRRRTGPEYESAMTDADDRWVPIRRVESTLWPCVFSG